MPFPAVAGPTDVLTARLLSKNPSRQLGANPWRWRTRAAPAARCWVRRRCYARAGGTAIPRCCRDAPAEQINAPVMMARAPSTIRLRDFTPVGCVSRGPERACRQCGIEGEVPGRPVAHGTGAAAGQINFRQRGQRQHFTPPLWRTVQRRRPASSLARGPYRGNARPSRGHHRRPGADDVFQSGHRAAPYPRRHGLRPLAVTSRARDRVAFAGRRHCRRNRASRWRSIAGPAWFTRAGTPKEIVGKLAWRPRAGAR
ncbi:hypothetical protein ACU4GD_31455 [Cupriavidus basilensis]